MLQAEATSAQGTRSVKPIAFAVLAAPIERNKVQFHTRSVITPGIIPKNSLDFQFTDPGYRPYVPAGLVSLVGHDQKIAVKILRDRGALDLSFIYPSVALRN